MLPIACTTTECLAEEGIDLFASSFRNQKREESKERDRLQEEKDILDLLELFGNKKN